MADKLIQKELEIDKVNVRMSIRPLQIVIAHLF